MQDRKKLILDIFFRKKSQRLM